MNFGQSIGFLVFLISLYVLWKIQQLMLLIFMAMIFAVALNRLVRVFLDFNVSRKYATLAISVISVIILNILVIVILPPFIEQFQLLINTLPRVWEEINPSLENFYSNYVEGNFAVPSFNDIISSYSSLGSNLFNNFLVVFSNVVAVALQIGFVLFLTVVFLLNPSRYRHYCLKLFPSFYRRRASEIFDKSEGAIVGWLSGILINCLFIGTLSGVGLLIFQVKLVLVHALLAGLLNFIPNIGPTISVVFPVMIALLDSPWKIVAILIWYFMIQNIESYWLTPKVMADKVSLLPAVTLFAQIFFAQSFGVIGLLLALPLTVVVKTWVEEVLFKDILDKWGGETE
ncbi:AI-2E family transporter [Cyanobacterium stanieri LEGE 03274]|uniref:AI-2E family transporter n=1 Tax=Cyanobacterium stanieri LEGE 03274 TaxID=1828756 RepID=A0ABR9V2I7_9CHRO|nr:AI-2E family transporter [Cyanobacterium stanieri]MBE9222117.1 AI-2E family transporter [Cyanobacterium stanieri LEGE 03274]